MMVRRLLISLFLLLIPLLASCRSAPATPTPPPSNLYRNTTYGFSIAFPSDWAEEETGGLSPIVEITAPDRTPVVRVFMRYLPEVTPLTKHATSVMEEELSTLPQFTLLRQGELPAISGYEVEFTWVSDTTAVKGNLTFVMRGTQVFEIFALAQPATFDRNQATIDRIITSFKLEEPQPYGIPRSQALTLYDEGPITLDPALSREMRSHSFVVQLFGGLVTFDRELNLLPDLSTGWQISPDGKTYTFTLRRGAKFHNGREIKADDFKYSWERAADPQTGSKTAETYLGDIVGVKEKLQGKATAIRGLKVIDDYTLEVTIDSPKSYFLYKLTYPVAFVVDRENVAQSGEWWRKPNGSGPFKLKEWRPDELLVLERNPDYHLGPAKIGYVVFRLYGGIPMQMYEAGEIDAAYVSISDIDRVRDVTNPLNRELTVVPELSLAYLGFNAQVPPFDDPLVRQAFSLALNKDKIVSTLLKGIVERAEGILPPGLPGYNPSLKPLGYDPARAQELLRASRYSGQLPAITLTIGGEGTPDYIAAILQDWQQALGAQVTVRQLDPEIYFYRLKQEKDHIYSSGWGADYPDPQNFLDLLFHSQSEENFSDYQNTEIDSLLERARSLPLGQARQELYQQIEQRLIDDAAVLPLWFGKNYLLVKPYVKGYVVSPMGIPMLREVSLAGR